MAGATTSPYWRIGHQSDAVSKMSDGYPVILVWLIFATAVVLIAVVQSGFEQGGRFTLRNLFLFASLLAILLGLFILL